MPRICSICSHPDRPEVDKALVAGEPIRGIAALFRVSPDAVQRHKEHIPQELKLAADAQRVASADGLLAEVNKLRLKAYGLLQKAEQAGDYRTAISGVKEARGCLELLGKLMGQLNDNPQINIVISPQWQQVRVLLMEALSPYPDARIAVAG